MDKCVKKQETAAPADLSEKWAEIEAAYGAEVREALEMLHGYYDGPRIAEWIASLYDPEVGGFYYCKSARDTDGYLPDLESTSQALSVLSELGAIPSDRINEIFPERIRARMVEFARGLQSPADGYFYHPQWPQGRENLNTDRYGRDMRNATSILRRVWYDGDGDGIAEQHYPKYCTVDGVKCALHKGTDGTCRFPIPGAVIPAPKPAEVIAVAPKKSPSQGHPVYTSESDFLAWLRGYNATVHVDSGRAHNLAALIDEIRMHGYGDVLADYLDEMQRTLFEEQQYLGEAPTGIWQRPINYHSVWGMYKYLYIYNNLGRAVDLKYVPYMVDTCIKVIKLPPVKNYAYNDLMNQWSAISVLIANVRQHYGDGEAEKIYARVRKGAADLISNSLEKMRPFRMEDGSFCNSVKGVSTPVIYGTPIAVGGIAEGNVNSTHILLNMYFSICRVLGCPAVPLCDISVGKSIADRLAKK